MLTEGYVLNQRYQILRVLSDKGGMGVIYQATDLSFNNTVVIKHSRFTEQFLKQQHPAMPPDQLRSHAEYLRKAFEREARLVRGLKHHALPTVIDYFTTGDGHQFFVMDFIPGKDFGELLDERLRQNHGPFPLDRVLDWADQLLDALDYLHTRYESPIIHRDLKPSNLKLTPDGRIVLLDFGLAKGATPGMSIVSASIHGYTLNYAPLEQIRGKGTNVRSDLYSLAVTLHHLLSGAVPPSAVDRVTETTSGEVDPLRTLHEINPQIPAATSEVIQRAAALNPNERYASAAEMREALHPPISTTILAPSDPKFVPPSPNPPKDNPTIIQPSQLSGAVPPSAVDRVTETTSGEADPLRTLHEINPQIPAATSEVIQRAAALNPNECYASAAEMREALHPPIPTTIPAPSDPKSVPPSPNPPKDNPTIIQPSQRKTFLLRYICVSAIGMTVGGTLGQLFVADLLGGFPSHASASFFASALLFISLSITALLQTLVLKRYFEKTKLWPLMYASLYSVWLSGYLPMILDYRKFSDLLSNWTLAKTDGSNPRF